MERARRAWLVIAIACAIGVLGATPAAADEPRPTPATADPDAQQRAREAFKEGARLVDASEWAAALSAFERSLSHQRHSLTLYNIGVCQRFLGRYTLAAGTFGGLVGSAELPEMFREQTKAYLDEIQRKLARIALDVQQTDATIAIDGRPLAQQTSGEWVAGVAPPGEGKRIPSARFVVIADPGSHVLTFQLEGHDTVEIRRDLKAGTEDAVSVSLTEQAAEVVIDSDRPHAVVRVDDVDVGLTPVTATRPPGRHSITVTKEGFVTYSSTLVLRPGQRSRLVAELPVERIPLTKRWWFWTAAVGIIATGAIVTYAATRPAPDPPPYEVGSTGWLVPVR